MIKNIDMTKEKVVDQQVDEQNGFNEAEANTSCEGESCVNMAEDAEQDSATMSEQTESSDKEPQGEPSPEEVIAIWRDKYMRLQAEFDNYRKRTLREKIAEVRRGLAPEECNRD